MEMLISCPMHVVESKDLIKFFQVLRPAWQECIRSCNDINAADWKAVLDAMDRDAMDAGDEAVDLASDKDMAGAAEAEAMAVEKDF
eukprot:366256-Chlamydomonas_euryale.AAC.15